MSEPNTDSYIYAVCIVYNGRVIKLCPYKEDELALNPKIWWAFTGQSDIPAERVINAFENYLKQGTIKFQHEGREVTAEVKLIRIKPEDVPFPALLNLKISKGAVLDKPHVIWDSDQYKKRSMWRSTADYTRSQEIILSVVRTLQNDSVKRQLHVAKVHEAEDFRRAVTPARNKRRKRRMNVQRMLTIGALSAVVLLLLSVIGFGSYMFATGKIQLPSGISVSTGGDEPPADDPAASGEAGEQPPAEPGSETAPTEAPAPTSAPAAPADSAPASTGQEIAVVRGQDTKLTINTSGREVIVTVNVRLSDDGMRVTGTMNAGGTPVPVDQLVYYPDNNQQTTIEYLKLPANLAGGQPLNLGYFKRNILRTLSFVPVNE